MGLGLSYCFFFLSCLFSINSVLPQTLSVCFLFVFSNLVVLTLSKRVIRNTPPFVCGLVKSLGSVKFLLGQLDLLMFQRSFAVSRCSFDPPIPPGGYLIVFFFSRACFQ